MSYPGRSTLVREECKLEGCKLVREGCKLALKGHTPAEEGCIPCTQAVAGTEEAGTFLYSKYMYGIHTQKGYNMHDKTHE